MGSQIVIMLLFSGFLIDFGGCIVSAVPMTRGKTIMHVNAEASSLLSDYCVVDVIDALNFGTYIVIFTDFPQQYVQEGSC